MKYRKENVSPRFVSGSNAGSGAARKGDGQPAGDTDRKKTFESQRKPAGDTDRKRNSESERKPAGVRRITKPEDNLCLAVLAWIHILLLCAGLYLLTSLIFMTETPTELPAQRTKEHSGLSARTTEELSELPPQGTEEHSGLSAKTTEEPAQATEKLSGLSARTTEEPAQATEELSGSPDLTTKDSGELQNLTKEELIELLAQTARTPAELLAETLWLLIPLALGWVFIRVIRSLVVYLLCSAAVCALLAALSHSALTPVLAALLLAARCYTRIQKGRIRRLMLEMPGEAGAQASPELWEIPTFLDRPSPRHWILFVLYYAVFLITRHEQLMRWVFFLLLADIFVCFLFGYLDSTQQFIRENRRIANLPVHSIQKVGRILLLICTILLALIVLPSALYGREPLLGLRDRIQSVEFTPSTEFEEMGPGGFSAPDPDMFGVETAEPPAWLVTLANIINYLIVAVFAAALLVAIYRMCRNALDYFAQDEEDEILFLGTEETSGVHSGRRHLHTKKERRNSPNQRIRRLYKRTIRRAVKERPAGTAGPDSRELPAGWETPSELEAKAKLARDESTDKLHTLYEKARYSREGCTEAEAELLFTPPLSREVISGQNARKSRG